MLMMMERGRCGKDSSSGTFFALLTCFPHFFIFYYICDCRRFLWFFQALSYFAFFFIHNGSQLQI